MTPEREREIRKIAGRDGQTWRSSAVSLVALNDVIDELDELRGKVAALEQYAHDELNAAMLIRDMGQPFCAAVAFKGLVKYGRKLGLFSDPLTKVPAKVEPQPSIQDRLDAISLKDLAESGSDEFLEMMNKTVQHFHDDCVFYANCPACVAGHAGVFNREKGTDRKCEARFDGGRTHDCEVFPSQFKYPHCHVCGQHHEPPACTAS